MRYLSIILIAITTFTCLAAFSTASLGSGEEKQKVFSVHPIGYVKKIDGKTVIVLNKKYQPGLLGMEKQDEIWVLWWFDRNDTPEKRSILQVHPRGNPDNPLTGVFATRAPVRPNLIALTKCKVIAVKDNVIEIESIDAFPDTPVLDIKSVIGGSD
jgi:tRNA-Thr(GGU) m(6)t(6)A37 methyltransferase TsaA